MHDLGLLGAQSSLSEKTCSAQNHIKLGRSVAGIEDSACPDFIYACPVSKHIKVSRQTNAKPSSRVCTKAT